MPQDVLIVGAGPTGLMVAAQLLRWGVRSRIIDARPGPSTQTRAVGVVPRTVEILEQMGLSDAALAQGVPARAMNLFADRGKLSRIALGDIGAGLSPFPFMLTLAQDRTEAILRGDLAARGLEVEWNTRLEHFVPTASGAQAILSHSDLSHSDMSHSGEAQTKARTQTLECRFLLGADGARSQVRKGLGLEFEGSTYDHRFFVTDLRIEGEAVEGELNLFLSNRFYLLAAFPLPGQRRFRLVGIYPEALAKPENPRFDDLQPYFAEVIGTRMRFEDVTEFSSYRVHHRVAERFGQGNVFLLGDAAHVHSPVGGQGMNTGLQDAYNLAWKLALRSEANARLLESYHEERRPNALKLVATTDRAFTLIVSRSAWMRWVRLWLMPTLVPLLLRFEGVRHLGFLTVSQTALNYRGRRLSVNKLEGHIQAGDRFPWFVYAGQDVFEQMTGTRFTLFALGNWTARKAELERLRCNLLETVFISDPAAFSGVGLSSGLYLVRPDGYIGLCTHQLEDVSGYLEQTVGLNLPQKRLERNVAQV